jgi:hypothetical protein
MHRAHVLLSLLAICFIGTTTRAAFVLNVNQAGSDVVMIGSGSIDTAALNHLDIGGVVGEVHASTGEVYTGPTSITSIAVFDSISGPSNFGTGGSVLASSGSGNTVGVSGNALIFAGASGAPLSSTDTYSGKTLASLGLTPGTYVWTWGSGADADSFTVNILAPEPASLSLLGLAGLVLVRRRSAGAMGK